jgi:tRNA A-37 threonylcarbamoyl transferase component Bud32
MLEAVVAPVAQLQPGALVGGEFRVRNLLAQGGMGAVYVAEQASTGKLRALKIMHPSLVADPGLTERFVQEARIGSMIPSDHVVEVVGAGVDAATGLPWLAMELLSGEDLAQYVARRGPLPLPELPVVLRPVFHALAAAHARGIVHRDIKPENIYLASAMSSTHPTIVKVLDFGIAKVAAQALGTATTAMGSPMWMAPEQTEAYSHVSAATDVWSLGLLTFWLLTGRSYWRSVQAGTSSVAQLMREFLFEPLVPASLRASELGVVAPLPPGFDAWFARCVTRNPAERFSDATAAGTHLFQDVLGVTASATLGVVPTVSAPRLSVPHAQPIPPAVYAAPAFSATAVPTVTPTRGSSGAGVGIAVLGGGAFVALGLVAAAGIGAFAYLSAAPSEAPPATPPATVATPQGPQPTAVETTPTPAAAAPRELGVAPRPPTATPTVTQAPPADTATTSEGLAPQPTAESQPAPKPAPYKVGQNVDVNWKGSWWQGTVTAVKGDKFLVHYIGWSSSWDEWVTTARLRPWTGTARK